MKKKILIFVNDYNNIVNLRYNLISYLRLFYEVEILVIDKIKNNNKIKNIYSLNKKYKSINILKDFILLFKIFNFLKKRSPDLVINFTIKPLIYGTLTSYFLKIKSINVVTGLGSIFINKISKKFYTIFLKIILNLNTHVIFQNKSDKKIFNFNNKSSDIINGSGYDYFKFKYIKKKGGNNFNFLMVSRLIKDKGIGEYLEAARNIKNKYKKKVNFFLMSSIDNSLFSFPLSKIYNYKKYVKFIKFNKKEYFNLLNLSDCFVLPSYREGFSKTILEASSMGKFILTTDVPGCRDIVIHKKTGILSKAKDVKSLIYWMRFIYSLKNKEREKISFDGSQRVKKKFTYDTINKQYLRVIKKII